MVSFFKRIWNKITGKNYSPPPAGPRPNANEIENEIDSIVEKYIRDYSCLWSFSNSVKYWQSVVKAMAFAESSFNPFETFYEEDLADAKGNDRVTGMRYLSEGLLQLSYSDKIIYHCDFDIENDRYKSEYDRSKTIFNVEKNIKCGLSILNKMVFRKGHYIFNSDNYWAVLKPSNRRHKVFLNKLKEYLEV